MTLREFLLHKTAIGELCIIRDQGWVISSCWIDAEDLFLIHPNIGNREVKKDSWGKIDVVNKFEQGVSVPCHYIDI